MIKEATTAKQYMEAEMTVYKMLTSKNYSVSV